MIDKHIGAIGKLEQDYLRRIVLREHDASASTGIAPEFITNAAAFALRSGYHVILEGILHTGRYTRALRALITEHVGPSFVYYLDVSFEETVRRHASRPQALDFDPTRCVTGLSTMTYSAQRLSTSSPSPQRSSRR